jgi:hypothetical protein
MSILNGIEQEICRAWVQEMPEMPAKVDDVMSQPSSLADKRGTAHYKEQGQPEHTDDRCPDRKVHFGGEQQTH